MEVGDWRELSFREKEGKLIFWIICREKKKVGASWIKSWKKDLRIFPLWDCQCKRLMEEKVRSLRGTIYRITLKIGICIEWRIWISFFFLPPIRKSPETTIQIILSSSILIKLFQRTSFWKAWFFLNIFNSIDEMICFLKSK